MICQSMRQPATKILASIFVVALFCLPFPVLAQETAGANSTADSEIAATVIDEKITMDQVNRDLSRSLGKIVLSPEQTHRAQAATLEKLINQKVVFDFLEGHQALVGEGEIELRLDELKSQLATVEKTIDDYLKETDQTLEELSFQFAWRASWPRYLEQKLTDEILESHFKKHKRQMDGTELRVAHLLLKPAEQTSLSEKEHEELTQAAAEIAARIASTSITWDEAVSKHSAAPTRDSGGEIGWIKIDGPMPESFTQAAFKLSTGEISAPVQTKFGVHVIKCLEVKEGRLGWRDSIDAVKKSAARMYFDSIATKHRGNLKIEYDQRFKPRTN